MASESLRISCSGTVKVTEMPVGRDAFCMVGRELKC
jgi:hypothetical protein